MKAGANVPFANSHVDLAANFLAKHLNLGIFLGVPACVLQQVQLHVERSLRYAFLRIEGIRGLLQ